MMAIIATTALQAVARDLIKFPDLAACILLSTMYIALLCTDGPWGWDLDAHHASRLSDVHSPPWMGIHLGSECTVPTE
jgi:hypothetical protein